MDLKRRGFFKLLFAAPMAVGLVKEILEAEVAPTSLPKVNDMLAVKSSGIDVKSRGVYGSPGPVVWGETQSAVTGIYSTEIDNRVLTCPVLSSTEEMVMWLTSLGDL
jgi:hypothetical protein